MKNFNLAVPNVKSYKNLMILSCFCIISLIRTSACAAPQNDAFYYEPFNITQHVFDENYSDTPWPGTYDDADGQDMIDTYNALYYAGRLMAVTYTVFAGPITGINDPYALEKTLDYVPALDYVFGVMEPLSVGKFGLEEEITYGDTLDSIDEMVSLVRGSANSDINNARIGNYNFYPAANCYVHSSPLESTDRSDKRADYLNSGMNVAMPDCYPYSRYTDHAKFLRWPFSPAPNDRAALFWAPLSIFSESAKEMPALHQHIPWVAEYWTWDENPTQDPDERPTRADNLALLQHFRLRGADGYYAYRRFDDLVYSSDDDFRDAYMTAWRELDYHVDPNAMNIEMTLGTNREDGQEWSGTRSRNNVTILLTNLGDSTWNYQLSSTFTNPWHLSVSSVSVPTNTNKLISYVIRNMLDNGDFNTGSTDWTLTGSGTWLSSGGVDNSGCLELTEGGAEAATGSPVYVRANEEMQISYYAKGEDGGETLRLKYTYHSSGGTELGQSNVMTSIGTSYKKYISTLTIPNNSDIAYIRPVLSNNSSAATPNTAWIDSIVIKFYDPRPVRVNIDADSGMAVDKMKTLFTGEVYGDPDIVSGPFGDAYDFDGSTDWIEFSYTAILDLEGSRTVSAWIKPDDLDDSVIAIQYAAYGLEIASGKLWGYVNGSSQGAFSTSNESLTTGVWQHVAMSFDFDGDKKVRLYINGKEVSYYSQTTMVGTPNESSNEHFRIGGTTSGYYFNGCIDEVLVSDQALCESRIFDEMAAVLYAPLDQSEGANAAEIRNGNEGILAGGAYWTGAAVTGGQSIFLDGTDDYVDFGTTADIDVSGSLSISAWILPDVLGAGYKVIAGKAMWGASLFASDGKLRGFIAGSGTNANSTSVENLATGVWQHVAMTFDVNGDKKIHLYINGKEASYAAQTAMTGSPDVSIYYNFTIGSDRGLDYFFDGRIDEVKVFRQAIGKDKVFAEYATVFDAPLNESAGNTVHDDRKGNNGTLNGGAYWSGVAISGGKSLFLDGTDDFADFGTAADIDVSGSLSISAWIMPDVLGTGYKVIAGKALTGASLSISNGKLYGFIDGTGTDATSTSVESLTTGVWQHVAMTFDVDGSKKIHLYINGKETDYTAQVAMTGSPAVNNYSFTIGSDRGLDYFFDGRIDEVKVFRQDIGPHQVFAEYATVFDAPLNESAGNTVHDEKNGNDGTLSGGAYWSGSAVTGGYSLFLDGSDDYADFGKAADLELTGSRTITAWILPDTLGAGYKTIAGKGMWASSLFSSDSRIRGYIFSEGTSASSMSSTNLATGVWQHVAMTFDINGDKKIYLYVNGEEVSGYSIQTAMSGSPASTANYAFAIGSDRGLDYFFDGRIDEVKVFRTALNAQQVMDEYALIFHAPLNEGSGDTVHDARDGNNGERNDAAWVTGTDGGALDFDGTDDDVNFSKPAALELTGSRTIAAWIYPDTLSGGYETIAGKGMWASSLFTSSGKLRAYVYSTGTSASSMSSTSLGTGAWQHVAMTFDTSTGNIRLYINGSEVSYSNQTAMSGSPASTANYDFTIGSDRGLDYFFDGKVDDVKVFNRALTSSQIQALYNSY